jgi:hypothetical protein
MQSGLRLALLKPAALPVTPPTDPPLSLLLLRCILKLCLVFVILFMLFIAWQCSLVVASWCTLCVGTLKFSGGVMVYWLWIVPPTPRSHEIHVCKLVEENYIGNGTSPHVNQERGKARGMGRTPPLQQVFLLRSVAKSSLPVSKVSCRKLMCVVLLKIKIRLNSRMKLAWWGAVWLNPQQNSFLNLCRKCLHHWHVFLYFYTWAKLHDRMIARDLWS